MKLKKVRYILIILLLHVYFLSNGQDATPDLSKKVTLTAGNYSLGEILDALAKQGFNITYDAQNLPLNIRFHIKYNNPNLEKILNLITSNSPISYSLIDNYIIFKRKNPDEFYVLSGRIIDNSTSEPIIAANIYIKEKQNGCITDTNGFFSIKLPPSEYTLTFSCIGYEKTVLRVKNYENQQLNIKLTPSQKEIDEVIISGEKNNQDILNKGMAIESLSSKEISKLSNSNASEALHATMPGVWVIKSSGLPGDHHNIRVRGISSIIATLDPLFIVDGFQVPIINLYSMGISDLNANDIDKITVYKDASATNMYGYQGGNGVILINTKNGGKNQINFSSTHGIQKVSKMYNLMNSLEFYTTMDDIYKKFDKRIYAYYPKYDSSITNDNWQDKIFKTGEINEYNLSASGNIKGYYYYISGSYTQHDGIIQNTNYKRQTFTSKIRKTFKDRLDISLIYWGSYQENHNNLNNIGGNNLLYEGISKPPSFKTLKIKPSKVVTDLINYNDPDSLVHNTNKNLNISIHNIGASTNLKISKEIDIFASSSLGFRTNTFDINYVNLNQFKDEKYLLADKENYIILDQQVYLQWHKQMGKHDFFGKIMYKKYIDNAYWDFDTTNYLAENKEPDKGIFIKGSLILNGFKGTILRSIQSTYAQLGYNFAEKYFIQFSVNKQVLNEDKTIGIEQIFPSVALMWNIHNESLIKNWEWLNNLSLYANWGISGNYPLNGLKNFKFTSRGYYYGDSLIVGSSIYTLANRKLKEEEIHEYNLGSKASVLNNRVKIKLNFFDKINENMILIKSIPQIYNGGLSYINVGIIETRGWEYSVTIQPFNSKNFSWLSHINITTGSQIINQLDVTYHDTASKDELRPDFILKEGEKFGQMKGYKYYGYWTTEDELKKNTEAYQNLRNEEGMKFSKSREVVGKSVPDYSWNWLNTFTIHDFTIDILWYGVSGITKYNATRAATYSTGTNKEIKKFITDSVPGFSSVTFLHSSYFFEDASYIKLKQLRFSYQHPKKIFNTAMATFALSFENLITFTKYKGYDPESTIYTENGFSDNAIDHGAYPNPVSIYASISLTF